MNDTLTIDKIKAACDFVRSMPPSPPALRLVKSEAMVKWEHPMPKTRKPRIIKKWSKKYGCWVPRVDVVVVREGPMAGTVFAHPVTAARIRRELRSLPAATEPVGLYGLTLDL